MGGGLPASPGHRICPGGHREIPVLAGGHCGAAPRGLLPAHRYGPGVREGLCGNGLPAGVQVTLPITMQDLDVYRCKVVIK